MRIFLVTDTHLAPGAAGARANWAAARAFAARSGADLTVHLGDITRDACSAPDELAFAASEAADWPTPIRFIPGNHDIGDNPPGEDEPSKQPLSADLLALYRAAFGDDRWALDTVGADGEAAWRLIALNAQLFGTGTREELAQWEWLAEVIDDAGDRPLAIFSHKPLFQNDLAGEPPHIRYVPTTQRRRVLDLLGRADWRLWLSGHTHQLLDRMAGGARHIWVPSTAYRFPETMQERIGEKIVGAALLTLGPAGASFDLVAPEGLTQFEYAPAQR